MTGLIVGALILGMSTVFVTLLAVTAPTIEEYDLPPDHWYMTQCQAESQAEDDGQSEDDSES